MSMRQLGSCPAHSFFRFLNQLEFLISRAIAPELMWMKIPQAIPSAQDSVASWELSICVTQLRNRIMMMLPMATNSNCLFIFGSPFLLFPFLFVLGEGF